MILLFCIPAFAKIFRVGYNGTPLKGVDYISITEANDSAKVGDTIQIYGEIVPEIGIINKRLVILGFGYDFNNHPGLQSNPGLGGSELDNPSSLSLDIKEGADSSIIEGCSGRLCWRVAANKVIFRRCSNLTIVLHNDLHSINDIKIYSCYNFRVNEQTNNLCFQAAASKFPCQNIQMLNCINGQMKLQFAGSTGSIINCIDSYNNYQTGESSEAKVLIKNCIEKDYICCNGDNTIWDNNIFNLGASNPPLAGNNNKYSQVRDSIFVNINSNLSDESNYQLRTNSPAKNFGIDFSGNPTDCGIFGGELAYRYKIGGQPAIPSFYKLSAPTNAATTNPYNITISVRSNN